MTEWTQGYIWGGVVSYMVFVALPKIGKYLAGRKP